eukprot:jgi/Chlat1/4211/Chrsp27S04301
MLTHSKQPYRARRQAAALVQAALLTRPSCRDVAGHFGSIQYSRQKTAMASVFQSVVYTTWAGLLLMLLVATPLPTQGACPTQDKNGALCLTGDASDPNTQCYCIPWIDATTGANSVQDESQHFTWNDGQLQCESIGGTLAQIYSEAEKTTILNVIKPYITVWIGLSRNDAVNGAQWDALPCPPPTQAQCPARVDLFKWGGHTWGTGTIPQSYQDWWIDNDMLYEPDNTYYSRDEYCVFMVGYGNQPPAQPGTWDDDLCYSTYPIVCSVPQIGASNPSSPPPTASLPPPTPTLSPPPSPPPGPQTAINNFVSLDIAATTPGTTTYTAKTGVWQITNCGANMWDAADSFRYVYSTKTYAGSVTITAKVLTQDLKNFPNMKAALGPQQLNFWLQRHGKLLPPFSCRRTDSSPFNPCTLPVYLKISRTGTTFTSSASTNGVSWTVINTYTPAAGSPLLSSIYVGMGVCSVTYGSTCKPLATATLSNVAVQ